MYIGIDIGGTKTLVATLDDNGIILERQKIPTAKEYEGFPEKIADTVASMTTHGVIAAGVAAPGKLDRHRGTVIAAGNLPWQSAPLRSDLARLFKCPVVIENDGNLGGLSEAMLVQGQYSRVLYVTVGTGIGTGVIFNQAIDPAFADSEGGHMPIEHQGKMIPWEKFAGGKAIFEHYGKRAEDISEAADWRRIAENLAKGLIDLVAFMQPEVIIIGGGVSAYFDRLEEPLRLAMKKYETPMVIIPPIKQAERPEDAVVYGCYDLAKATYGTVTS